MQKIYLDNAATTSIRPEVITEMVRVLQSEYGNPSSNHFAGRSAKGVVENSRKLIAKLLNVSASEIVFTSGATEGTNWILIGAVSQHGIARIITTKIEHHAILDAVEKLHKSHNVQIDFVKIKPDGQIDIQHLQQLLSEDVKTLVCLMHVNNEIGIVLDLEKVGNICKEYNALFFSDAVQSVGKMPLDLQALPVDFISSSAHKFHGPKGVGFIYMKKGLSMASTTSGGSQEKGLRSGTECVHNIAGMSKAFEISMQYLEEECELIQSLKDYTRTQLERNFPGVKINGNLSSTLYNILNVCLPFDEQKTLMILFHLDLKGIAVSRGSACQSGSISPSHVLAEILELEDQKKPSIRISFDHNNTTSDIDALIAALKTV